MNGSQSAVRSATWTEPVGLADQLWSSTGLPVVIDNDVMALTRAQSWFGLGRGLDRFALITLGIGIGIVMHGKLTRSDDAGLGLAQHFPLDAAGPFCPLGHQGCAAVANLTMCYRIIITGELRPTCPSAPPRR